VLRRWLLAFCEALGFVSEQRKIDRLRRERLFALRGSRNEGGSDFPTAGPF